MGKARISDVARLAGVSTATVSHVINNTRFVSEATRQRVLQSIAELDYSPNEMARILKTGKKKLIGFIVPDISNEYFSALIEEVERTVASQSYKLIVTNTRENEQNELDSVRALTSGMVDGLLVASTAHSFKALRDAVPEDFPVVLVDRTFPDSTFSSLIISSHRAVYQGVTAMIEKGHQNIGYIAGLQHISTAIERLRAYKDALNDSHIPIREDLICFGDSLHNSGNLYVGQLLERGCTAIAVSNNAMAEDVIYYCHKHGVVIGKDVDIRTSNLDDRRYYYLGKMGYVRQPALELAQAAGQQIMDCIANPNAPAKDKIFQATYMEIGG